MTGTCWRDCSGRKGREVGGGWLADGPEVRQGQMIMAKRVITVQSSLTFKAESSVLPEHKVKTIA